MWTQVKPILASAVRSRWAPLALAIVAGLLYLRFAPSMPSIFQSKQGPVVVAPTPPKVADKVPTKRIKPPESGLVAYEKSKLSGTLKMPELNSQPGEPVAVTEVAPHAGKTTVVAVLDNNTGVTSMLTRQEATPFFQLKRDFQMNVRYLFVGANQIEADVIARPLRIGPVEVEAGGGFEVRRQDGTLGARGWIGATYRF